MILVDLYGWSDCKDGIMRSVELVNMGIEGRWDVGDLGFGAAAAVNWSLVALGGVFGVVFGGWWWQWRDVRLPAVRECDGLCAV